MDFICFAARLKCYYEGGVGLQKTLNHAGTKKRASGMSMPGRDSDSDDDDDSEVGNVHYTTLLRRGTGIDIPIEHTCGVMFFAAWMPLRLCTLDGYFFCGDGVEFFRRSPPLAPPFASLITYLYYCKALAFGLEVFTSTRVQQILASPFLVLFLLTTMCFRSELATAIFTP